MNHIKDKFSLLSFVDKDFTIKDPIHKEINFHTEKWVWDFITTKEFKRLKDVYQLGLGFKVFPSATNNRYMHSIGTFQVALKFVEVLYSQISLYEKKLFLITALLHDIGHGPYSHVFEKITNVDHESITKELILSHKSSINKLLIANKIKPQDVVDVLDGISRYEWINKLISSNIDVDRIDYMLRDSYFIGTHYSTIDIDFLIKRIHLIDSDVFFAHSTINVIESFLLGRYYMHQDIYDNKNTYIYEWSLMSIFNRLKEIKEIFVSHKEQIYYYDLYSDLILKEKYTFDFDKFLKFTDNSFVSFIDSLKVIEDKILNSFLNGFLNQEGLVALDYSKKESVLKTIKEANKKINLKYLYHETEKGEKIVYLDDDKHQINIIDTRTCKLSKFDKSRISGFNNQQKKEKIILVNKNLII